MALFDNALASLNLEPNPYIGDPPSNEAEYLEKITWPEGVTAPSWADIEAQVNLEKVRKERVLQYPSLEEQLDMQYWDSINGTTVWADTIAAIKAKYPKPE